MSFIPHRIFPVDHTCFALNPQQFPVNTSESDGLCYYSGEPAGKEWKHFPGTIEKG